MSSRMLAWKLAMRARSSGSSASAKLACFKHPKALVVLNELPRKASGKVTKRTLRENDPA